MSDSLNNQTNNETEQNDQNNNNNFRSNATEDMINTSKMDNTNNNSLILKKTEVSEASTSGLFLGQLTICSNNKEEKMNTSINNNSETTSIMPKSDKNENGCRSGINEPLSSVDELISNEETSIANKREPNHNATVINDTEASGSKINHTSAKVPIRSEFKQNETVDAKNEPCESKPKSDNDEAITSENENQHKENIVEPVKHTHLESELAESEPSQSKPKSGNDGTEQSCDLKYTKSQATELEACEGKPTLDAGEPISSVREFELGKSEITRNAPSESAFSHNGNHVTESEPSGSKPKPGIEPIASGGQFVAENQTEHKTDMEGNIRSESTPESIESGAVKTTYIFVPSTTASLPGSSITTSNSSELTGAIPKAVLSFVASEKNPTPTEVSGMPSTTSSTTISLDSNITTSICSNDTMFGTTNVTDTTSTTGLLFGLPSSISATIGISFTSNTMTTSKPSGTTFGATNSSDATPTKRVTFQIPSTTSTAARIGSSFNTNAVSKSNETFGISTSTDAKPKTGVSLGTPSLTTSTSGFDAGSNTTITTNTSGTTFGGANSASDIPKTGFSFGTPNTEVSTVTNLNISTPIGFSFGTPSSTTSTNNSEPFTSTGLFGSVSSDAPNSNSSNSASKPVRAILGVIKSTDAIPKAGFSFGIPSTSITTAGVSFGSNTATSSKSSSNIFGIANSETSKTTNKKNPEPIKFSFGKSRPSTSTTGFSFNSNTTRKLSGIKVGILESIDPISKSVFSVGISDSETSKTTNKNDSASRRCSFEKPSTTASASKSSGAQLAKSSSTGTIPKTGFPFTYRIPNPTTTSTTGFNFGLNTATTKSSRIISGATNLTGTIPMTGFSFETPSATTTSTSGISFGSNTTTTKSSATISNTTNSTGAIPKTSYSFGIPSASSSSTKGICFGSNTTTTKSSATISTGAVLKTGFAFGIPSTTITTTGVSFGSNTTTASSKLNETTSGISSARFVPKVGFSFGIPNSTTSTDGMNFGSNATTMKSSATISNTTNSTGAIPKTSFSFGILNSTTSTGISFGLNTTTTKSSGTISGATNPAGAIPKTEFSFGIPSNKTSSTNGISFGLNTTTTKSSATISTGAVPKTGFAFEMPSTTITTTGVSFDSNTTTTSSKSNETTSGISSARFVPKTSFSFGIPNSTTSTTGINFGSNATTTKTSATISNTTNSTGAIPKTSFSFGIPNTTITSATRISVGSNTTTTSSNLTTSCISSTGSIPKTTFSFGIPNSTSKSGAIFGSPTSFSTIPQIGIPNTGISSGISQGSFQNAASNSPFNFRTPMNCSNQSPNGAGTLFSRNTEWSGTGIVRYQPTKGRDSVIKGSWEQYDIDVRICVISCMKEYERKSLDELRYEDYMAGRKGGYVIAAEKHYRFKSIVYYNYDGFPQSPSMHRCLFCTYETICIFDKHFDQSKSSRITSAVANTWNSFSASSSADSGLFGSVSYSWTGTSLVRYKPTTDEENCNICVISELKEYKSKSLDELRYEDYVAGRKGRSPHTCSFCPSDTFCSYDTSHNAGGVRSISIPGFGSQPSGAFASPNHNYSPFTAALTPLPQGLGNNLIGATNNTSSTFGSPSIFSSLATSNTVTNTGQSVFGSSSTNNPVTNAGHSFFGTSSTNNPVTNAGHSFFGTSSMNNPVTDAGQRVFGSSSTNNTATNTGQSVFDTLAAASNASIFGATNNSLNIIDAPSITPNRASTFSVPCTSSTFGGSSTSSRIFGAPNTSAGTSSGPINNSAFYAASTNKISPNFALSRASNATNSPINESASANSPLVSSNSINTPRSNLFGAPSTSQLNAPSTSIFGAPTTSQLNAPGTSVFCAPSTSQLNAPSTSIFGAPSTSQLNTPRSNLFGAPITSQLNTPSTSLFGAPSTSQLNTPSTSLFGAPSTSQLNAPSTSIFRAPSTSQLNAPGTSVFSAPSTSQLNAPGTSVFSAPSTSQLNTPSTSLFGASSTIKTPLNASATIVNSSQSSTDDSTDGNSSSCPYPYTPGSSYGGNRQSNSGNSTSNSNRFEATSSNSSGIGARTSNNAVGTRLTSGNNVAASRLGVSGNSTSGLSVASNSGSGLSVTTANGNVVVTNACITTSGNNVASNSGIRLGVANTNASGLATNTPNAVASTSAGILASHDEANASTDIPSTSNTNNTSNTSNQTCVNIPGNLLARWEAILKQGMSETSKEILRREYSVPGNVSLLEGAELNTEMATNENVPEQLKNTDKVLKEHQDQLGNGITAVIKAMDLILNEQDMTQAIRALCNATRLLSDLHYQKTQERVNNLLTLLREDVVEVLKETERDGTMFGSDVGERVEIANMFKRSNVEEGGDDVREDLLGGGDQMRNGLDQLELSRMFQLLREDLSTFKTDLSLKISELGEKVNHRVRGENNSEAVTSDLSTVTLSRQERDNESVTSDMQNMTLSGEDGGSENITRDITINVTRSEANVERDVENFTRDLANLSRDLANLKRDLTNATCDMPHITLPRENRNSESVTYDISNITLQREHRRSGSITHDMSNVTPDSPNVTHPREERDSEYLARYMSNATPSEIEMDSVSVTYVMSDDISTLPRNVGEHESNT